MAVLGYASLDTTVAAARFNGVDATTIIRTQPGPNRVSPGGIAHIALPLAATTSVAAVSWVGSDPAGTTWLDALAEAHIDGSGIATTGSRSPTATLIELDSGGTICLFEPGDLDTDDLTRAQTTVVADADWLVVNVGPTTGIRSALQIVPDTARVAFAVKRDEAALPPDLTAALLDRADVVSCSTAEHAWLTERHGRLRSVMRPDAVLVETRGRDGVVWSRGGGPRRAVPPARIVPGDATGAGDTFVGALVARLATDPPGDDAGIEAAVRAATTAVGDALRRRARRSMEKEIL